MPTGPNGEKRPGSVIANAVHVMEIATGQREEECADVKPSRSVPARRAGGLKGGKARAASLSSKRRSEIARKAAEARWGRKLA